MKKFFTLIAAVAMAASVNAQGTYAVQIGDKIAPGDKITSVENATLTFMENSGATYNDGKDTPNWVVKDFVAYTAGKNNGKLVKEAEPTGCVYKFETTKAGTLTVGVQLSPNKGLHVLNSSFEDIDLASYNLPASKDAVESQKLTTNDKGEAIIPNDGAKSNGTITFNVESNGTYYVLAAGTKLGFFGFTYTVGTSTGISTISSVASAKSTATYNLAGQQVSDSYKGIVIQNGKKFLKK